MASRLRPTLGGHCHRHVTVLALVLLASGAAAQSGNVVISSNTTWPEGTYTLDSLTVQNGATLSIGGGSTVTVAGAIIVAGNSRILLQGKNTTGPVGRQWVGVGSTIQAGSVQVDAGSQISADAQGYTASQGPGGGVTYYTGGTHGGSGSSNPAPTYGSYLAPIDLGSGGMTWGGAPSTGGGAIRLIVSGALTNNGTITANGGAVNGTGAGAAGGSIYVTTGVLGGSGAFTAGGSGPGGGSTAFGGGGRIAIYYGTNDGFDLAKVTAAAGGGTATAGSVYLLENNANLFVPTALILPPDTSASYGNVTVLNGATLKLGGGSILTVTGLLRVTGAATLLVQSKNTTGQVGGQWRGVGSTIQAGSVQVDAGSQISADAQGYTMSQGPGGGVEYFHGGTYGGSGSGNPKPTYGSLLAPLDLGSGGMTYGGAPSTGGGAIRLIVSGALTNNGTITANGGAVSGTGAGAAGGSIYVTTGVLGGTGAFTAGGSGPGGGSTAFGGGGRIAIYYGTSTFNHAKITANSGGGVATAGTVALVISPPTVTGIAPGAAPAGMPVTLTGTGFTWATQVRFNGTIQPVFTIVSDTQIAAVVPAGATAGPVQVLTAGGTATSAAMFVVMPVSALTRACDFDGDGRADPTVFRPREHAWFELLSTTGTGRGADWGVSTDVLVPADYDGDGRTDEAVYRPSSGTWFVMRSLTHQGMSVVWGLPDDIPVPADYDGDGKTDVAVYRPATGVWYIIRSATNTAVGIAWGVAGDVPVPADFDGDRKADPTVFRPSTGTWYELRSATGTGFGVVWGQAGDVPLAADYDGDAKADPTVFRANTGTWYELRSSTGGGYGVVWGMAGDLPIAGDYDGDGKADPTVFRPSTGTWFQLRSSTGAGHGVFWGNATDVPL